MEGRKHLEHNYSHTLTANQRGNYIRWTIIQSGKFFPLLLFFFFSSLHSSSLMDGKTCRCGFSLICESTCFIRKGLGSLREKSPKPEPLISGPRDRPGLWLKVLSRSSKVYNQLYWLDVIGTADKDIRSVCSHWVRQCTKSPH